MKQILATDVQFHGIDLLNSRKFDSAKEALGITLEFFESQYEKDPEDPENYPFICKALYQSGRLQQALNHFDEAAKIFDSLLPAVENCSNQIPKIPKPGKGRNQLHRRRRSVLSYREV